MIKNWLKLSVATSAIFLAAACGQKQEKAQEHKGQAAQEQPAKMAEAKKPELGTWGVDLTSRDQAVKPGDDFFKYTSGKWYDSYTIPADRTSYGAFQALRDRSEERVKTIIEEVSAKHAAEGTPEQKVGDYYASWMDTDAVNKLGISPLQGDLDHIAAIKDKADLIQEFGNSEYDNSASPIRAGWDFNRKNPDLYELDIVTGGLGLPDKVYYLDKTERFQKIREAYVANIAKMLNFAYKDEARAKADADKILALETKLAEPQWARAEKRDADKTYNPMTLDELKAKYPGFDWDAFLKAHGYKQDIKDLNLSYPSATGPVIDVINATDLDTWKAYLTYHLISSNAYLLSDEIDNANFDFYGKVLNGQQEQRPRWKRGVSIVGAQNGLGEALGQLYVQRYFPPEAKAKMVELVENLRKAYGQRIDALDWMSPETKKAAHEKLATFRPKIGYPDKWLDLSGIKIVRGDLFGNARRVRKFFEDRDNARIGQKTDRDEWFMTPQTVNAYYNPPFNEIVFPAAILQPPFFDPNADMAVNYGAIGAVIGHEMGHGFDDQGAKFDAKGVQRDWWTPADFKAFHERTEALAGQYDKYEAIPGAFVNGKLTLGENIGDLGGVSAALTAYKLSLHGKDAPVIDGFTGLQRFFLGYGQVWKSKMRDQLTLRLVKTNPHSPAMFRVNGVVRNVPQWYEAFDVKPGDKLYLPPEKRVKIW
ncbi:M13 family metallopeptidase [Kordiimonas marina]|uniref:M13 family metallopeptidase n=1 Tax=Kordiimonas marina TaxID=2872312 RepID=UPI001FF39209|nr:M13 family metallopeptidase [Kordiimonas marina]MCJ9427832.1 M13 family metallopeptidase [Kordiimonas marina]